MGTRIDKKLRGIMIPDPRCGVAGLAVNDGSAAGSSYTETGPRPGSSTSDDSRSRALVVVTGALVAPIEVATAQGGNAEIGPSGARVKYRLEGAPDSDWHGHNSPQHAGYFSEVFYPVAAPAANVAFSAEVDPISQRIKVICLNQTGSASRCSVGLDAWEDCGAPFGTAYPDLCSALLPSGRWIAWTGSGISGGPSLVYTDAENLIAWSPYSSRPISEDTGFFATPAARGRMAATGDGSVLLLISDGVGEVAQYASRNLGVTFDLVQSAFVLGNAAVDPLCSIAVTPAGLVVSYLTTGGAAAVRILGTPFDRLSDSAEITVAPAGQTRLDITADPRGVLYAVYGPAQTLSVASSIDGGLTWGEHAFGPWNGEPGLAGPREFVLVAARGSLWLILSGQADVTSEGRIGCLCLGGWSNYERGSDSTVLLPRTEQRQIGWYDETAAVASRTYIPIGSPVVVSGFTHMGLLTGVFSFGMHTLQTFGNDGYWFRSLSDGVGCSAYFSTLPKVAGGSITAEEHAWRVRCSDAGGTLGFGIKCHITATALGVGFRLIEMGSGAALFTLATGSGYLAPGGQQDPFLEFQVRIQSNITKRGIVYYKRSNETVWTLAIDVVLAAGAYGSGPLVAYGAIVAGTTTQQWRSLHFCEQAPIVSTVLGAAISSRAYPAALLGTVDDDEAAFSLRGGPMVAGETYTVPTIHEFPIDAAMWDSGPSRSEQWRSETDAIEQILTWAFSDPTRIGDSFLLSLMVLDANFNTAILEVNNGAGWVTVSTLELDQGFTDLAYDRDGDILRPGVVAGGLLEGGRFLNRAELAGGVARWGGGGVASIVRQSAGGWADSSTNTIQPLVRVDGALAGTGTTSTFPGDVLQLSAPSGVVVAHLTSAVGLGVEGVRVRIQPIATVEGYLRAGLVMVGTVSIFGQQPARGYSVETKPNALRSTSIAGTVTKYEQGAPATSFSMAWPDGVKLQPMRAGIDVDYLGPAGRPPAVAAGDVWGQLRGMIEETKSGEIPIVYLPDLPAHNVTLTDRTLFGFGTLDGSARFDHVLGNEGVDEFGRVAGVKLTGIE